MSVSWADILAWHGPAGHSKAVAYVRFTDGGEVMSASTDSTLRLWDLKSEVRTLHISSSRFLQKVVLSGVTILRQLCSMCTLGVAL